MTGVIHDIDNPVSESFFHIDRKERRGTVLSTAAITPFKNTLSQVNAAARLTANGRDVELRLVGSLDHKDYVQRVREWIKQKELEEHTLLLGGLDTEQVYKELSVAGIFALTSLEGNSPMGIEEAMAPGVLVVTSNRCGMPSMVRDGESGFLVDPNDTDNIAR